MATKAPTPILFAGSPDALEAVVPVPSAARQSIRLVFDDAPDLQPRVLTSAVGADATLVRLVASTTSAPGRYLARLVSDHEELPAVVEVAAQPQVSLHPATLTFRCAPGGTASVEVAIQNTGNTAVAPRKVYAIGLLEDGSIDAAIGVGLRIRRQPGESRFERVGDELADRYGGMARLRVNDLDGQVEPGTTGLGTAELQLDERARGGRHYHGLWIFEGSKIPVAVVTPRRPTPKPAPDTPTVEGPR